MQRGLRHGAFGTRTQGIPFGLVLWETLVLVLVLLAISERSVALSASSSSSLLKYPPLDPCLEYYTERSFPSPTTNNDGRSTIAADAECPVFHPNFCDGRVCVRCCRDDYEIGAWQGLSPLEKGFALEDATDRARQRAAETKKHDAGGDPELFARDSIPAEELERQAAEWMSLAKAETMVSKIVSTAPKIPQNESNDLDSKNGRKAEPPSISITSPVGLSSDADTSSRTTPLTETNALPVTISNTESSGREKSQSSEPPRSETKTAVGKPPQPTEKNDLSLLPPPPTPCTRICRYNQNCFDGKVCIGCFRETHEIAGWSSMSPTEKQYSLEDAADRSRELAAAAAAEAAATAAADPMQAGADVDAHASFLDEDAHKDASEHFEGGISEAELRRQAVLWGAWKG